MLYLCLYSFFFTIYVPPSKLKTTENNWNCFPFHSFHQKPGKFYIVLFIVIQFITYNHETTGFHLDNFVSYRRFLYLFHVLPLLFPYPLFLQQCQASPYLMCIVELNCHHLLKQFNFSYLSNVFFKYKSKRFLLDLFHLFKILFQYHFSIH